MDSLSSRSSTVRIEEPRPRMLDAPKKLFKSKSIIPQLFAAFAASVSAFSMGTVEAFSSPAIPSMKQMNSFGDLTADEQSLIATIALIAALLSGPQIGYLIGKIGRKSILIISSLPLVIGWFLIASAKSLTMVYIGRFLTGFCAGAISLAVPIYISEIAEDQYRGLLCSGFQLMVTLGNFTVYLLGLFLDWRWNSFICGIVPLFGVLIMAIVPPTPIFLISRNRFDDARTSLRFLRAGISKEDVEIELNAIQTNLLACKKERTSYKDIFKPRTFRPLLICLFLLFFQQLTGIEAILIYTVHIFQSADVKLDPNLCTIIVGGLQVIATFTSAILVDKTGRRLLLMISELGVTISMLCLTVFFYLKNSRSCSYLIEEGGYSEWVPLTAICIFISFFAIGIGPVPFLLLTELNSSAVIGIASALATTFNWTFAYIATAFFMDIEYEIGLEWCFALFSVFSLVGGVFIYVFVPETKNISMEQIQDYFRKSFKVKIHKCNDSKNKNPMCHINQIDLATSNSSTTTIVDDDDKEGSGSTTIMTGTGL